MLYSISNSSFKHVHKQLERAVFPLEISVRVKSPEDKWALRLIASDQVYVSFNVVISNRVYDLAVGIQTLLLHGLTVRAIMITTPSS